MLVDFIFKNSYSFKDENVFSMEKDSGNEFHDINTFECGFKKIELLKSSIIYGANGSGKSNFIKSIKGMKNLILYSVIPLGAMNDIKSFKFFSSIVSLIIKIADIMLGIITIIDDININFLTLCCFS